MITRGVHIAMIAWKIVVWIFQSYFKNIAAASARARLTVHPQLNAALEMANDLWGTNAPQINKYASGIFGCLDNKTICVKGVFCPCWLMAETQTDACALVTFLKLRFRPLRRALTRPRLSHSLSLHRLHPFS
jgi:hypothetical protein